MDPHLIKYRITPQVVRANKVQRIEAEGLDFYCRLYDDIDYIVKITTTENWHYKEQSDYLTSDRDILTEITVRPVNGVISFEYYFEGEKEWLIRIVRKSSKKYIPESYEKYGWVSRVKELFEIGFAFRVYSLEDDLYGKRPYKGDLHLHTRGSDGTESPEVAAASYRKHGFDFISITDHYTMKSSVEAIEKFSGIDTQFKIFPGEEVHPKISGVFHMVNFGGRRSVNEIVHENPDMVEKEVEAIAEKIDIEDIKDRKEVAWFKWICDTIRKTGGISIYPHPYWIMKSGAQNVNTRITDELFTRKIFDVFEVIGGVGKVHNCLQAQLYYEMKAKGYDFPVVGSSDAHCSLSEKTGDFNHMWTVVFSDTAENIPKNIMDGMSVAVENYDDKNVYGSLRLSKYTWFLIENYYEMHDEYCSAAGQAIMRYVLGDKSQGKLISLLENELEKFNKLFFGM